MTQVIKHQNQLPATIEEIQQYVLVGEQQIKAHQAKLDAIKRIPQASIFEAAALKEAQAFAEVVIAAKAKFGELIAALVKSKSYTGFQQRNSVLPAGITKKESHKAQAIYKNPEIVEQVLEKAKEEKRIPTPNEVLRAINKKSAQSHAEWTVESSLFKIEKAIRDEWKIWEKQGKDKSLFKKAITRMLGDL